MSVVNIPLVETWGKIIAIREYRRRKDGSLDITLNLSEEESRKFLEHFRWGEMLGMVLYPLPNQDVLRDGDGEYITLRPKSKDRRFLDSVESEQLRSGLRNKEKEEEPMLDSESGAD